MKFKPMAKHAHEMETLKEGTWYIRGCDEFGDYFQKNNIRLYGDCADVGYYIEDGKWECDEIKDLTHRTEITLQDYLDSLETACAKNAQTELIEKSEQVESGIEIRGKVYPITPQDCEDVLKSIGKFVFPKAPEGDFPDLSNFKAPIMNVGIGNNWHKDRKVFCKIWGNIIADFNGRKLWAYKEVRPIQKPKLTLAELCEKAGLDINNIEIIE